MPAVRDVSARGEANAGRWASPPHIVYHPEAEQVPGSDAEFYAYRSRSAASRGARPEIVEPLRSVRLYQVAQSKVLGDRCYTGVDLAKNTVPQIAAALKA